MWLLLFPSYIFPLPSMQTSQHWCWYFFWNGIKFLHISHHNPFFYIRLALIHSHQDIALVSVLLLRFLQENSICLMLFSQRKTLFMISMRLSEKYGLSRNFIIIKIIVMAAYCVLHIYSMESVNITINYPCKCKKLSEYENVTDTYAVPQVLTLGKMW